MRLVHGNKFSPVIFGAGILALALAFVGLMGWGTGIEPKSKSGFEEEMLRIIDAAQLWYSKPAQIGGGDRSFVGLDFKKLGLGGQVVGTEIMKAENTMRTFDEISWRKEALIRRYLLAIKISGAQVLRGKYGGYGLENITAFTFDLVGQSAGGYRAEVREIQFDARPVIKTVWVENPLIFSLETAPESK